MIRPNRPSTELKISMTRILTKLFDIRISCRNDMVVSVNLQGRISSIGQRSTTAVDTNSDTADQVAHSNRQPGPE